MICALCDQDVPEKQEHTCNKWAGGKVVGSIIRTPVAIACEICDGPCDSTVCLNCWNPTAKENGEMFEQIRELKREKQQMLLQVSDLQKQLDACGQMRREWEAGEAEALRQNEDLKKGISSIMDDAVRYRDECATANRLIEVLRNALVKIEAHAPKNYEPNQEHWEWGNFDDSYGYGLETGYHRMGEIASTALKETNPEKR